MIEPVNLDYENTPASWKRPPFSYAPADPPMRPHVTIVTPFYNEGPIFHDTARTVLRQSFQQWEWIIVNDGSIDPLALEVLAAYRTLDPRIRVIDSSANGGPSAARNLAFRVARAPYVVHLDSDNLLEPTALEKWLWYLETHPECAFVKGFTVGFGAEQYLSTAGFHDGPAFLTANRVDTTSMIRRDVHLAVGGFDETITEGLEDWEFWLRCADAGFWGGSLPETLDWYRRRTSHADRWKTWDGGERERRFGLDLRRRFPKLWNGTFPTVAPREHVPHATVPDNLPWDNTLTKTAPRLLVIVPWLALGGSDKFSLDLVEALTRRGWEVTIATTLEGDHRWEPEFARHTPDIFALHRFLNLTDYPRFLRYLAQSRRVDAVLLTHSELAYQLLPYLRAHLADVAFLDFCHIEEQWKNGGYPRAAVEYQELLDLNVVSSQHLRRWMIARGADDERIRVCYTGVDSDRWRPDAAVRAAVRAELGIGDAVPLLLYAGRLCDQKQPRVFAATMERLNRQGIQLAAVVAGDGPDLEWLRRFIKLRGLHQSVRLLGGVSNRRINELMKAADIFFLPSAWEGIAISIYEAMASGLAVIGADVGGQSELVTPDCGVLIERREPQLEADEYSRTLAQWAADPARVTALGLAARARVCAEFRLEDMGTSMVTLIERAIALHAQSPRPVPGVGLGRAVAAQAIETTRMSREFDRLWHVLHASGHTHAPTGSRWREHAYAICRALYRPLYQRGMARGGAWYFPLANGIKRWLRRETA